MIEKKATAQETLDVIGDFLSQVRSEKEAETVSFKDKPEATPTEQSKPKASEGQVNQTNLGKEQTQDADDGGSTADSTPANSDEKGKSPVDDQGPKTLDTDEPVSEDGNIGPMRKQEITQEQKMARASRLGNAILTKMAEELGAMGETEDEPPKQKTAEDGDDVEVKDDTDKEASEAVDEFLDACLQKSAAYAQNAHDSYLMGILKRAQDEAELAGADFSQIGIDADMLEKMGGISGLLDKVAAEDAMAVMPEGYDEGMMGMGMDAGMPAEEAGMSEGDLAGLADALAEAGVEPEAIDEAAQAVAQLAEAGVAPEEAAEAIREVVDESMGAGEVAGEEAGEVAAEEAAETSAEEAAEEAAPMEVEASENKEARERISAAANFLREKLGN